MPAALFTPGRGSGSGSGALAGRVRRLERVRGIHTSCSTCGGHGLWVVRYQNEPIPGWHAAPGGDATGCPTCGRQRELVVRYVVENALGEPVSQ